MPISKPKQARSERTLEKILDACDSLLETRTFEQITMAELAKEASISVGNLYNRFADKDALVQHITERAQHRFDLRFSAALADAPDELALKPRLLLLGTTFQREIANLRPIFVALISSIKADDLPLKVSTEAIIEHAADWLMLSAAEIPGRQKRQRCRFVFASIAFNLQFDVLLGTATRLFGDEFVERLVVQSYSYLKDPTR